jgi:hypothetical protein
MCLSFKSTGSHLFGQGLPVPLLALIFKDVNVFITCGASLPETVNFSFKLRNLSLIWEDKFVIDFKKLYHVINVELFLLSLE